MYTATEIYGGIHDIFSVYPKGRVFFLTTSHRYSLSLFILKVSNLRSFGVSLLFWTTVGASSNPEKIWNLAFGQSNI